MDNKITIIIPVYNGEIFLYGLISSLISQKYKHFRVIFVNDCSTDKTAEILNKINDDRFTILHNQQNQGYAGSVITAYKLVNTKYVMLLNVDVSFDRDFLKDLLKHIKTSKDIAMVCPISFNHREELIFYGDLFYNQNKSVSITYTGNNVIVDAKYHPKTNNLIEIFYHGVFLAKTELIGDKIFDEDYYMYCEDMHLCWRLKLQGYKVYIAPEIYYWHSGNHSKRASKRVNKIASFHGAKNKVMTLMIYHKYSVLIKLIPLIFISELIYLCYEPRKILLKLKAYWWIVLNIGKIHQKHKLVDRSYKLEFSHKIYDKFYLFPLNLLSKLYCWVVGL